jgi:hypothetical protein
MQRKLSTCPPLGKVEPNILGNKNRDTFKTLVCCLAPPFSKVEQKQRHIQNTRMLFGSTFLKVEQKQRHIQNTRMLFGSTFLKGGLKSGRLYNIDIHIATQ